MGTICPVCGRTLTVGVASRVEELGKEEIETESSVDKFGVRWIKDKSKMKPGYVMLVPLLEILSEALDSGVGSKTVLLGYDKLINTLGSEFKVLLETKLADIEKVAGSKVMEGISKVRSGDIVIEPGYDGVFGKVRIWKGEAEVPEAKEAIDQGALF
ncbi:MAG: PHP domain protein [Candidatus Woesebacteria bacterium GW2011_GWB1_40_101]|nr:MAG: PHP domain protein [Candidatus Woesebacteria bacterium GW2011_GWB1_40_101]